MGDAVMAPSPAETQTFATRGELEFVRQDLKAVERDLVVLKASVDDQSSKMSLILAAVQKLSSVRGWVGWAVVTATSAGVATILSHLAINPS